MALCHAVGLASTALIPAGHGGWIGYWSPGIGDPSPIGWVTVVCYFVAAVACLFTGRRVASTQATGEARFWWVVFAGLLVLGVNKQLDLQTAMTELGRILAAEQGWYEYRHKVQRAFILGIGLGAAAAVLVLLRLLRRTPVATHLSMLGTVALLAFVVVRASSMHHVDLIIRSSLWGIRGNWVIEIGGILVVLMGACLRLYQLRRASGKPRPALVEAER